MKMQFELDLEDIFSDYEEHDSVAEMLSSRIQETIMNGIEDKVVNRVVSNIESELNAKIQNKLTDIENRIDAKAENMLNDFMNRKVNITDRWGDVVKSNVSIVDLMKEKFDNFLDQEVDRDGKPTSYGGTKRINHIIDNKFQRDISLITDRTVKEVNKRIKEEVESQLGKKISHKLLNELNILGDVK